MSATTTTKKFLLIGIDGTRPDALLISDAPNLKNLIMHDRTRFSMHVDTGAIPISGPSWTTIHKGVTYEQHGIPDNDFDVPGAKGDAFPSVYSLLRKEKGISTFHFLSHWDGMSRVLITDKPNIAFDEKSDEASLNTFLAKVDPATNTTCPDAMFLYFDEVDHAGHHHGFGPHIKEYRNAIHDADVMTGKALAAIAARSAAFPSEEWFLVLLCDHGGSSTIDMPAPIWKAYTDQCGDQPDAGVHGLRMLPQHNIGFLILHRPTHAGWPQGAGEIIPPPGTIDVAPTILKWFEAVQPAHMSGKALI
jgi:hypothetical protein